jgi:hypothetical protein
MNAIPNSSSAVVSHGPAANIFPLLSFMGSYLATAADYGGITWQRACMLTN